MILMIPTIQKSKIAATSTALFLVNEILVHALSCRSQADALQQVTGDRELNCNLQKVRIDWSQNLQNLCI